MMDAAERALLATTVRDAIANAPASAPASADAGAAGAVDAALAGLGWLEMLEAETSDAIEVVFRAIGAAHATSSLLDDVVVSALGTQPRADLAVLLPVFASWEPPGETAGNDLRALGLATSRCVDARELLVVASTGSGASAVTVPMSATEISVVQGIDPDAGFHVVRVECDAVTPTHLDAGAWDAAVALGQRAVATQMAGGARAMLELARAHAVERVQFDRPVARFQAVRHRLAEALVAVEALDATLVAATDEPNPTTAALAKAVAGRTADTVAGHCQQVLAGIGFTTDHPFHRFLKQTMVLGGLFGTADRIVSSLGRRLLAERHVPTLIEL